MTRVFNIRSDTLQYISEPIFLNYIPPILTVTFVETSAFNGDYTKDPFIFGHHNVKSIKVITDATETRTTELVFDNDQHNNMHMAYRNLSSLMPASKNGVPITFENFERGIDWFAVFDILPFYGEDKLYPPVEGFIKLLITFKENTATGLTCLTTGYYQGVMKTDSKGHVEIESYNG